jgi:hypothetical protein
MKKLQLLKLGDGEAVLSTRERGHEAADRVQLALDRGSLVLSFDGVEIATPSYLDEIVRRLSGLLRGNQDHLVVVAGTNEEVAESLELVLEKHRMALARVQDQQLELLGGSAQLKKTLAVAQKLGGSFSAADLAKELELKVPNLHQRLKDLMEFGAVAREDDEDAVRGRKHLYDTPDAADLDVDTLVPA